MNNLSKKERAKLEAEIAAFDQTKTLREIELNAVGKSDVDLSGYQTPDLDRVGVWDLGGLEDTETLTPPDLQTLSAKLEVKEILTPRQFQIWRLCMRDGLSQEEVSAKLHMTQQAVSKLLTAAITKVKSHFGGQSVFENSSGY